MRFGWFSSHFRIQRRLSTISLPSIEQPIYLPVSQNQLLLSFKPKTVLIVKKPCDPTTTTALLSVLDYLEKQYPQLNVVLEKESLNSIPEKVRDRFYSVPNGMTNEYARTVDFAITLGGDGTILHTSSLFPKYVPPIISFSLGSLGFLLPFAFKNFKVAIDQLLEKQVPILKRMRLGYTVYFGNNVCETPNIQAMNELTVHRGRNAQLAVMDCYVGDEHLTDVVADGLIVSTPTGSTAYSLSAGGPIVHPLVDSIVLTPICPRSLSFRPIILPADVKVTLRVSSKSRDDVHVSVDGQEVFKLTPEHHLEVSKSIYPIPCVKAVQTDWMSSITKTLRWNQTFLNSKDH